MSERYVLTECAIQLAKVTEELATLREANRIRVTAGEPPKGSGYCIAWPAFLVVPTLVRNEIVREAPKAYPEWMPLPERPAR